MLILGIDPGTARLGYGLIETDKSTIKYITAGCLETKMETPMHERLLFLYAEMNKIFEKHKPDDLTVESLFFGINAKTAIAVGQARGVILLAAANNKVATVVEYQGLSVKFAVTGFGRSKKKEIQEGVRKILNMKEIVKPDDAADGLAIAITHHIKTHPQPVSKKKTVKKNVKA
ncbi:crossover junction endodeoxyribonuclease RuvC [Candidatus Microgenomates bacterium]|nr:crossover junction endodeoxyribonuclease RuvC [Candidatus Microgenomates bacterium]